ncbi:uncharacterized protein EV420DRAFT_1473788 [Desarmillaria tabescens]|uniref:AMP-activated protein kinase glycogen-binding domain-containing protein n=1 Tax=Armillaria tabescens TaxID=1929756 RepID=A0AA39T6K6_ARMTA|nr:uncharacterized protein EV420DRAFT_1473788 [Desarmillaria tabescens]KAK0468011.1 hypothetical protein EV420DRAFT_1473788 [Desarmillaria tabescens]
MWSLADWIHQRLEGVLFQPVAHVLFWIGKQMQRHLALNSTWCNLLPSSSTANMQNNHEVLFEWPHTEATMVVVYSISPRIVLDSRAAQQIPWDEKIAYKFIVDGQWTIAPSQPTETDSSGNVNNIYIAPSKPSPPTMDSTSPAETLDSSIAKTTEKPAANGDTPAVSDKQETEASSGGVSQVVSDMATAATVGTAAGLGYVASGVGAAVQSVVGVDPTDTEKRLLPNPLPKPYQNQHQNLLPLAVPEMPATEVEPAAPVVSEPVTEPTPAPSAEPVPPVEEQAKVNPEPISEPTPVPLAEPVPASMQQSTTSRRLLQQKRKKRLQLTVLPRSPPLLAAPSEPAPAEPAAEIPPAPAPKTEPASVPAPQTEPPTVPESTPAPAEPAVAPTSSDVIIGDVKSANHVASEKPPTNGPADKPLSQPEPAPVTPPPSAPSTPKKKEAFPSTESPSNSPSSSSKFGTSGSARKKRSSIFGKINIKHMFSPSKDKDKEKK